MSDIVQLKENGVLKYLKTHAKAVEGLGDYVNGKTVSVTPATGFSNYHADAKKSLRLTLQGRIALLTGVLKNTKDLTITDSTQSFLIANVSNIVTVSASGIVVNQGSSVERMNVMVDSNGDVLISRNVNTTGYTTIKAGSWLSINVPFAIENLEEVL